ncbi:MAG: hypothetical protein ABIH85_08585 [Candidatus Omnitrophota bacterium]
MKLIFQNASKIFFAIFITIGISISCFCNVLSYSEEEDLVLAHSPQYTSNIPVATVKKFPLPRGYHEGLFWHDSQIWVSNGKGGNTWIVSPEDGAIDGEIETIGSFTEAIVSVGRDIFKVTDWDDKKIYSVKIKNNKMEERGVVDIENASPAGIVSIGDKIYVITWERGFGTKYFLLEFDGNSNILRKIQIKRIHEPAHLAWDGNNLWITSWFNGFVYKIDIETLEILGSFKAPVSDTTGITWDGEFFWIVGTDSDLYKLKVG